MADDWFIRPDSDRLPLSGDQWVLVRRRLNAGEHRAHLKRSSHETADGGRRLDALDHGLSLVVAYLVDWSLVAMPIRDEMGRPFPPDALVAVVDNLDPDRFTEIRQAIEAHETTQDAKRAAEKKTAGTTTPAPISPSPSAAAGDSAGSANSTSTNAPS